MDASQLVYALDQALLKLPTKRRVGLGCPSCNISDGQLGDTPAGTPIDPNVASVLQAISDQNARMFTLSLITTVAIATSAIVAVIRNTKAIKHEEAAIKRLVVG